MRNATIHVVVIGGGFAGVNLIKRLSRDSRFRITLVDTNNYCFFPPLLYQVATAFIEPSNISYPFRRMFQGMKNTRFHLGTLTGINAANKEAITDTGILSYDYLVLATGTTVNFFGMENVTQHALPMKTINDALLIRNHLLLNMEKAVQAATLAAKEKHLNIVIAGGGPSGVEVAGMLAEFGKYIAVKEYPEITDLQAHIYLVDAGSALLGAMSTTAQEEAFAVLSKLGVHIKLNTAVKDFNDNIVYLSSGETIPTETLIWTSGVTGKTIAGIPDTALGRGKRILVNNINEIKDLPGAFAIGDIALQTTDPGFPDGHPQLAQVAMQQGTLLANNLIKIADQKAPQPFTYNNKGTMAIIAKYKAVADIKKSSFKGFFAWLVWLFIHIMPLVSYRNKIKLAFNWYWAFLSNNPTLRLIIRPEKPVHTTQQPTSLTTDPTKKM